MTTIARHKNLEKPCGGCRWMWHENCDDCNKYKCSTIRRYDNVYLCDDCNKIDIENTETI